MIVMKRLQISIDEDLDEALAIEAIRTKRSKAAIIRQLVLEKFGTKRATADPIARLIGDIDDEAGDIDSVVYSR